MPRAPRDQSDGLPRLLGRDMPGRGGAFDDVEPVRLRGEVLRRWTGYVSLVDRAGTGQILTGLRRPKATLFSLEPSL